jgi:hopanoid-associated phosphorylase
MPQCRGAPFLLVVCGLLAEARIAGGAGARTIAGGGQGEHLAGAIDRLISEGGGGLLSFGMAGGLAPGLAAGSILVPSLVIAGKERFPTDNGWSRRLRQMLPHSVASALIGVDAPAASVPAKAALHRGSGAAAVDMESHVAARAAAYHDLPFAVLRVIADPAERALPAAAIAGMGNAGRTDLWAVLRSLASSPAQLRPLLAVAADARAALAVLFKCRRLLGPGFGLPLTDRRAR